jgi:WD40 repeat protein
MYMKTAIVDAATGTPLIDLPYHNWVNTCAMQPSGADIEHLVCGGEGGLRIWQAASQAGWGGGGTEAICEEALGVISGCAVHGKSGRVASCGNERPLVQIWTLDGKLDRDLHLPSDSDWLLCVAFSPSGARVVASTSGSGGLFVWSTTSADLLCSTSATAVQPSAALGWCCFSCSGEYIVTSSAAKYIALWKLTGDISSCGGAGGGSDVELELELAGQFPALGRFGSPDGVGGQGVITGAATTSEKAAPASSKATAGEKANESECLAIGDLGGRLYKLALHFPAK